MENSNFLQYTLQHNSSSIQEYSKINKKPVEDDIVLKQSQDPVESNKINFVQNESDTITINGKTVGIFGSEDITDIDAASIIMNSTNPNPTEIVDGLPKLATTTYKNFTPEEIRNIKQAIYDLHHKSDPPSPTPVDPDPTPIDPDPSPDEDKETFINGLYDSFCDAESMFTYLSRITNGEITKSTGISRAQLIKLTQNETAEESNRGFFGTLNRIFCNVRFNTNEDDVLSFDEINNFIGEELGADAVEYLNKVNDYAAEIQRQYMLLTPQEKLEFVIERTIEYLDSAGLTNQKEALTRLINEPDTYNMTYSAKIGQIVITEIESDNPDYVTLGAYQSAGFTYTYTPNGTNSGQRYTGISYGFDYDSENADRGITLNTILLDANWYELVDTLVHELTHAAAYKYYPDPACEPTSDDKYNLRFNRSQLEAIRDILEADGLYDFYYNNFANIINNSATMTIPSGVHRGENAYDRLMYMLECQWGEYAAYQVDADFMDSIAGDVFNSSGNVWGNNTLTTAVSGAQEASTIHNHIDNAYNSAGLSIREFANSMGISVSSIVDADNDGKISYGDYYWYNGKNAYSKEAKPDWDWTTYNKNSNWSWSA